MMHKTSKPWWGRRFLEALESFTDPGQLARGRQWLSAHRISQWEVRGTRVEAQIHGKPNPYYGVHQTPVQQTWLEFAPIPHEAWDEALAHIGSRAGFICRLLFNEMPDEIERPLEELGLSLLPGSALEMGSGCTCPCPPHEAPCRHVTALCLLLAGRLDQDPFLLFELRGLSRAELIRRLKASPLGAALASALDEVPDRPRPAASFFTRPLVRPLPEAVSPRGFWRGQRKLPAGVEPPVPAAVAGILIRKGGDYPRFWGREDSFVEVMESFYEQVRKKGKDWL